jgi:membrane protein YdbS with pleckstrin-like domain
MPFKLSVFTHTNYTFEGKREKEEVEIFLYSHWIIIAVKVFSYLLLAVAPLIPFLIFLQYLLINGLAGIAFFAIVSYYMIVWSLLFYDMMNYLLDNWIVTDERIIDIVQHGFFNRTVAELDLVKVQDISVKMTGLIQTIFDYGDVDIQTAGATNKFKFKQIPHPNMVKDRIMKLVDEAKKKRGEHELL